MSNRAVFLDRDGTLIEHFDYLTDPDQVKLLPTVATALRRLKDRGFYLVLATNQSGVARGMLTEKTLLKIHDRLKQLLAEEGAYLDQIYYCPFHPEGAVEKYRRDSEMRKPSAGMLNLAARELNLDLKQCWVVGDDDRDIETGRQVSCRTILLNPRHSPLVRRGGGAPDFQAFNLQEAANLIIRYADQPPQPEPILADSNRQEESEGESDRQKKSENGSGQREKIDIESKPPAKKVAPSKRRKKSRPQPPPLSIPEFKPDLSETTAAVSEGPKIIAPESPLADETKSPATTPPMMVSSVTEPRDAPIPLRQDILTSSRRNTIRPSLEELTSPDPQVEADQEDQISPEKLSKTVRRHEIARRKASKHKITSDGKSPPEEDHPTQQLLWQILRELKTLNRRENFTEFSVAKLLAGLVQMIVFLCLIMALWFISGRQPSAEKAQVSLLLAVVFQTFTLTLLMMRR